MRGERLIPGARSSAPGRRVLGAAVALAGALACSGGAPAAPPSSWTVLVYLDGDNSLATAASLELEELAGASLSEGTTVLVQLDLPGVPTRRYRIIGGVAQQQGDDLGELNMAAPETLTEFIRWGTAAAPASHTALILWDHGNGWDERDGPQPPVPVARPAGGMANSILIDQGDGGTRGAFTSNARVAAAIHAAEVHLDLLGFDACFMGDLEALYEFRGEADVLVASEEDTPSQGWPYRALLARLAAHPGMSAEDLGAAAVDVYRRWAEDGYASRDAPEEVHRLTLAAFRSARLGQVAVDVDRLAGALLAGLAEEGSRAATIRRLRDARSEVQEIDRYVTPGVYVDAGDVARLVDPSSPLAQHLAAATIAAYHGSARPRATGASIVFFRDRSEITYDPNYHDWDPLTATGNAGAFIEETRWDELLAAYYDAAGL